MKVLLESNTFAVQDKLNLKVFPQQQQLPGKSLLPEQWGWTLKAAILVPVAKLLPPAPGKFLHSVSCTCTKNCGGKCSCVEADMKWSILCITCQEFSAPTVLHNLMKKIMTDDSESPTIAADASSIEDTGEHVDGHKQTHWF